MNTLDKLFGSHYVVNPKEIAHALGVSYVTAVRMIQAKHVQPIGGKWGRYRLTREQVHELFPNL